MMRTKFITKLIYVLSIVGLVLTGCSDNESIQTIQAIQELPSISNFTSHPIEGQYIIVLDDNYANKMTSNKNFDYDNRISFMKEKFTRDMVNIGLVKDNILATFGYTINGFSAKLTEKQVNLLKNDSRIKSIEQDQMITLSPIKIFKGKPGGGSGTPPAQETPWGITRVGGGAYNGSATAWIIDSGIDLDHPDLNVDTGRSKSFLRRGGPDDENGHGTHVAGTVAAKNNSEGVVGVAPGATLVAVRVLDRRGSGSTSGVIAGVDYVAANGQNGDVANMSLGGGISTALDNAVINAAASGVKFALAAGNESTDANNSSPARANHANIYTISAMDINDNFASFSNYGNPPIEFCAPGVAIKSTWKKGGYNTISGTSMAAPHVCGLLLLGNVATDGKVNGDPDGNPDSIAHN